MDENKTLEPRQRWPILIVLVLLFAGAVTTWTWYYATRPLQRVEYSGSNPSRRAAPVVAPLRAATNKEKQAAIAAIKAQLRAFRADDYELATRYQSNGLKQNFPSVSNFRRMMESSYPQFTRNKDIRFGAATASPDGKIINIPATVTGEDGVKIDAVYQMVLEDGQYRVGGVMGGNTGAPVPADPEGPRLPAGMEDLATLRT